MKSLTFEFSNYTKCFEFCRLVILLNVKFTYIPHEDQSIAKVIIEYNEEHELNIKSILNIK